MGHKLFTSHFPFNQVVGAFDISYKIGRPTTYRGEPDAGLPRL